MGAFGTADWRYKHLNRDITGRGVETLAREQGVVK